MTRHSLFSTSQTSYPFKGIHNFYVVGQQAAWRQHATHDTLKGGLHMTLQDGRVVPLLKYALGYESRLRLAGDLHEAVGLRGEFQNKA